MYERVRAQSGGCQRRNHASLPCYLNFSVSFLFGDTEGGGSSGNNNKRHSRVLAHLTPASDSCSRPLSYETVPIFLEIDLRP
jgi:hypothetical protein